MCHPQTDFRTVFRTHYRFVRATLRRLGVGQSELDDVAQDIFVIVYRKLDTFRIGSSMELWLFGICVRVASRHRRLARHRVQSQEEQPIEVIDGSPLPDDHAEIEQARSLVLSALDAVDPQRRAVFVMHDLNEFSATEIAETLSIPLGTIYSRIRVAREEFRQAVKRLSAHRGSR
ncbi:RNA polymerase sigma factor RpoE [Labilithrix luteola]|uniref:RNA polymerase sigma factor RpoE n=1 Tax=Labilithrix luteola TaxID=1391654 RepID=A0A0K1PT41_9BACT|nr:RNA polymerase sigma factor RpoE [Labilithrix luteola]